VIEAFEKILDSGGDCRMLQTDKGSEFVNSSFQQMLKRHNTYFYTSENEDIKAAVVERFNRTLKTKMYRYFTFKNTWRYTDILQDLVDSYNATRHRSIGMSPDEVTVANEAMVRSRLYPIKSVAKKPRYATGDTVRIAVGRRPFAKGYTAKWSSELFVISSRLPTVHVTYVLNDSLGEPIKGKFYEQELQKVERSGNEHFIVHNILKTRRGPDGKVGLDIRQNSTAGSMNSSLSTDGRWKFCGARVPKQEVVFICQIIA